MPRAHRYFLPDHVWHITHRCHKQEFLLRFSKDRRRWVRWLFEARKRYGLRVLNYIVTSNHIHLLVQDQGRGEIAASMRLVAGRTAREYNRRKRRKGAFWEDRYHATTVDTDEHLARCLVYIDLNMVRAGVVRHPGDWAASGYREVESPPKRYGIIDLKALMGLLAIRELEELQRARVQWVEDALRAGRAERDPAWSESVAVGRPEFLGAVKARLGVTGRHRKAVLVRHGHALRELGAAYSADLAPKKGVLSGYNLVFLEQ